MSLDDYLCWLTPLVVGLRCVRRGLTDYAAEPRRRTSERAVKRRAKRRADEQQRQQGESEQAR